jgi:hypothetical protein
VRCVSPTVGSPCSSFAVLPLLPGGVLPAHCSKAKSAQDAAKWTTVQNERVEMKRKLALYQSGLAFFGVVLMIVQVCCRTIRSS